ncbi:hypothetical protein Tco_0563476 [Tanacetum coccineum]
MANENVPTPAPTRSDDQILPFAAWVPIKKRNHLDKDWFTLDANLLREDLEITPIDQAHPFVSPPSGDTIMDFVNELGYPEVIHFVSSMVVNHLYQPWRAILSMINQCLIGKTYGHDRPRYPVLKMLWGIITNTNVDYAELMWEEFVQAMQTFLTDKANLGSPTKKGRKDKPHVIPYCRFTKLIICHLGRIHNINQRSASLFHLAEEDLRLGNLKFVSKGEINEVFGMPIPNELILTNIRNASYYNAYLEMVAKNDQKVAAEKEGKKKSASSKQLKPKPAIEKLSKPAPAPKPKVTKEKSSKASTAKPPKPKPAKENTFQLVDEPDEEPAHSEPVPKPEQESAEAIRPLPVVEGKGKANVTEEQVSQSLLALHTPKRRSTTDQFIFQRRTPATKKATTGPSAQSQDDTSTNIVCDSPSLADDETEEKTVELDQDQAGSDPGETHESRTPPVQVLMNKDQAGPDPRISRVALAGPDLEPTYDEFVTDLYPKVQESLKFPADEHVLLEDPLCSTRILSSMKNLEDAYAFGVSSLMINLLMMNWVNSMWKQKWFLWLLFQSIKHLPRFLHSPRHTTESELAERVATLEKKLLDLEQTNKNLDNTTRNLGSRVYTLELRDLPLKINEVFRENVKEAVQIALQAPLRYRIRNLSEEDMKEMLHQRMFESGTYKSLPEHITLYEALEASMARAQRDEFLAKKDKSRKRRCDDQDLPPPPPDSDLSKRRRHNTGASGLSQPLAPQSSAWKSLTLEMLFQAPLSNNPVIPTSHVLDAENNWANALATMYQAPTENSLLEKTGDMRTFMNWYCQKMGKTKLTQADLEDQIDWTNPEGDQVRIDINRHLPLSGPPGHVTVQNQFFFNHDLDYLRYGSKGSGQALSISKMKAARYHDFGLELLVHEHMWIDDLDQVARADHQEYTIAEKDFKNLYPSDFEDLNLLLLQGHLNHLPGSDIRMLSTALNLTKPGWDATGFEFKHDYTIIDSPCVVVFPISNNERKIMRFNEIYKFSDGTLTNIMEALDYRVKEYKVNRLNPGMNTRFWTDKDVERSKEFIHAIERRLKTRRIFQNLECFVGGRVRDIDYRLLQRTE